MTWRERIAAARERGAFSEEDMALWGEGDTCFVGEQRVRYGILFNLDMTGTGLTSLGPNTTDLQVNILRAIGANDFDAAERLLDHVEDRALILKRESA